MKYLCLIVILLCGCSYNARGNATKNTNQTPNYHSFNIQSIDLIPWDDQKFPKQYIKVGYIKPLSLMTVRDLQTPLLRQNGGAVWLKSDMTSIVVEDRSLHTYRYHTVILEDGIVYIDFPQDTSRQIRIIREDSEGNILWATKTPVVSLNNKGYANLRLHQGDFYFQFNNSEAQHATRLWRLDAETGALSDVLTLPDGNYSPIWINEGIAYWQDQSAIIAYELATQTQSIHANYPQFDKHQFKLLTPLPNHALLAIGPEDVVWTDREGNPISRRPISDFIPAGFDPTTMKINLYQAILQADGSLLYPAVTDEGVHIIQLTFN